jgi:hypothetical protein
MERGRVLPRLTEIEQRRGFPEAQAFVILKRRDSGRVNATRCEDTLSDWQSNLFQSRSGTISGSGSFVKDQIGL